MRAPLSPPPITPDSRALRSLRLAGWQGTGRNRVYSTWNAWRSSKHAGFDTRPVISRKLCELSTHFFHIRLPCASTQFRGKNVFCVKKLYRVPIPGFKHFFRLSTQHPVSSQKQWGSDKEIEYEYQKEMWRHKQSSKERDTKIKAYNSYPNWSK